MYKFYLNKKKPNLGVVACIVERKRNNVVIYLIFYSEFFLSFTFRFSHFLFSCFFFFAVPLSFFSTGECISNHSPLLHSLLFSVLLRFCATAKGIKPNQSCLIMFWACRRALVHFTLRLNFFTLFVWRMRMRVSVSVCVCVCVYVIRLCNRPFSFALNLDRQLTASLTLK